MRVFMKRKILSVETKRIHTHKQAPEHMSMLTIQNLILNTA